MDFNLVWSCFSADLSIFFALSDLALSYLEPFPVPRKSQQFMQVSHSVVVVVEVDFSGTEL